MGVEMSTTPRPRKPVANPLGRRLPKGARFATVEELYRLDGSDPAAAKALAVWTGGTGRYEGWMPLANLLHADSFSSSTFDYCPSGLVVVVKPW